MKEKRKKEKTGRKKEKNKQTTRGKFKQKAL